MNTEEIIQETASNDSNIGECPVCIQPLKSDSPDVHSFQCTSCGFQMCHHCWQRCLNESEEDGLCPGCKTLLPSSVTTD